MPDNRRRLTRHTLSDKLDVWDSETDERLGQLVNLHQEGMMVLGDFSFEENKLYSVRIHLPQALSDDGELVLGVDCLWVRADTETELQWSGFQIIDVGSEQIAVIQRVIARMAVQ
ncbi:PilZ domain-containing protein [Simiduia agarivorans]|uniref:PilZ domain-containing protein n=1 Tax=Simiduia agarivorans (strain DSM 21679 / JCM 13881 / BCRC 17597 / SA1) TaxID=1117647 RepID=K4KIV3_SIMAS|nr:PilZ domain-containing protein [Simiduia agarivorans]AFU99079.1 hypothetical protein M5M_09470 [Simiduia agarivorans SA1 = DSM 21679]